MRRKPLKIVAIGAGSGFGRGTVVDKGVKTLRLEVQNGSPLVDAVASVDWADLRLER